MEPAWKAAWEKHMVPAEACQRSVPDVVGQALSQVPGPWEAQRYPVLFCCVD